MSDSATCGVSRTEGRPPGGSPRFCSKAPDAPEPARPPSKQGHQATSTNSPAPPPIRGEGEDIILTERQSCYLGKSATWGKKQVAGNKECREVAARRNPSSTVPRSIIPHSPNPASLEAQPLRLLHLLLQTLPQTWRNWMRPRPRSLVEVQRDILVLRIC